MAKRSGGQPSKAPAKSPSPVGKGGPAEKPVEEPKPAEAKAEAPKVEAPKVEAPQVEAPKVEAPQVEAPKPAEPVKKPDLPRADERWDLHRHDIAYRIGEAAKHGRMRDVSDSGCRVEHEHEQPKVGATVEFEIPGKIGPIGRVRVKGTVQWVKPGRDDAKEFGVSFAKGQAEAVRKLLFHALVND